MANAFEQHNTEQRAVWDAFHAGQPIRVPVLIGTNPRIILLDPSLNINGITFKQYTQNADIMADVFIRHLHWVRHHLRFDQEMGLPDDGWKVWIDLQNFYEAAWFGAPVHFPDNNCPYASPWLTDDNKQAVFDRGVPDPFDDGGWLKRNWEFYDAFCAYKDAGREFHGRPIIQVDPAAMGTDGPFTIAMELRGDAACYDMIADPDYTHMLLDFITHATIVRISEYRKRMDLPIMADDFFYADDSIALISTDHFREYVLPYHRKLIDAFWTGKGTLSIHLCGDASRHFPTLKDELGITMFDTGFPIDLHEMRRQLGSDVLFQGGPRPSLLKDGPISEIEREVRDLLTGPAKEGKLILREGNNLAPCTPPAHIEAMYEAACKYGRYD
jgi:uroporphyrinogen-III decarboxylase